MITTVHLVATQLDDLPYAVPTFMFFSADVASDRALLDRFALLCTSQKTEDGVTLVWSLPDPAINWGAVHLSADEMVTYQEHNRRSGGVRLLLLDNASDTSAFTLAWDDFWVDWAGGQSSLETLEDQTAQFTGGCWRLAQQRHLAGDVDGALDALFAAVDAEFDRHPMLAAYALHDAALIASNAGFDDAWNYFETVALMVYPNCHDALIGLAMTVQQDTMKAIPLLARAHAVRPDDADLRVLATTFGRAAKRNPAKVRDAVLYAAQQVDLMAPVFVDKQGQPLTALKTEVLRHIRALQKRKSQA